MLIDSHCHLDHLDLTAYDGELDAALAAAHDEGVGGFLCVGADPDGFDDVLALAERREDVWATVGVHPLAVSAERLDADLEAVRARSEHPRVCALGETGLDYFKSERRGAEREAQREAFARHLRAGADTRLPVVVHTRSAAAETIELIERHGDPEVGGVLHCFAEDWETARAAIELGYYVSISGIVTFNSAGALREVVRRLPLERLLVETDAPWLSPAPWRGRPNEPRRVRRVAECIAELRGLSLEALAERTTANFHALFERTRAAAPAISR